MKLSTLRYRLSLRYFLLLAVTFGLLGAGVYEGLAWGLQRNLDAALLAQADHGARTVVAVLDRYYTDREVAPDMPVVEEAALREALLTSGRYAQLVELSTGIVKATTPNLGASPLLTPRRNLLKAAAGQPVYATLEIGGAQKVETFTPGRELLRTIFYPVRLPGSNYVLEVATPIVGITEALQKVRLILLGVTPILMLIAGIAGAVMINAILARVDNMARTARRIGAQSLDERLPERGPDEIGQLGETFNEMLDRLSLAFDRMRRFTADASHELKTPLTSIRGDAEVGLMRRRTPEEYRQILERVVEETDRMGAVLDALLLLARSDAGSAPLRRDLVEAGDLVEEVASLCQDRADRAGLSLKVDAPPGLLVHGDSMFLRQMLGNLVENAIKYTPRGGRVRVSAAGEGGRILLRVEDNGPGIPPEHQAQVFDRFYRVDSSHSSSTGGSGLGLAIARAIAREHGGDIEVANASGGGAVFTVFLPTVDALAPVDSTEPAVDPVEMLL
jgi:heavy metal sensor kinase